MQLLVPQQAEPSILQRRSGMRSRRSSGLRRCRSATDGSAAWYLATWPSEHIQLNDDTIWAGGPKDRCNPKALEALPEVRRLLFAGKNNQAAKLAEKTMLGIPPRVESYETLGDLRLTFHGMNNPTDYRRQLDLDAATVEVQFRAAMPSSPVSSLSPPSTKCW